MLCNLHCLTTQATGSGTGLRTSTLKTILNRFLNAHCPLRVQILPLKNIGHTKVYPIFLAGAVGFEPTTYSFGDCRSTS